MYVAPSMDDARQCSVLLLDRTNDSDESAPVSLFDGQCFDERYDREWWVLYTKSRQEKALSQYLRSRRTPHYLPLHKKYSLLRGRRVSSFIPVFSGYVFLFGDRDERLVALESNRIARTIHVPPSSQERFWGDLRQIQRLIDSGVPMSLESRIDAGQRVRVKSGRLAGLEGIVTQRRSGTRLLIAVDYLQQGASIEIDDFVLEVV